MLSGPQEMEILWKKVYWFIVGSRDYLKKKEKNIYLFYNASSLANKSHIQETLNLSTCADISTDKPGKSSDRCSWKVLGFAKIGNPK